MTNGRALGWVVDAVRWITGLSYALVGVNGLLRLMPMPEGVTPASMAFFAALRASGFMLPLLALSFLTGGLLLLWNRTVPLGLIVLAPPVTVIPLYNALLERQPLTSGPFVVAIHLFLAWYYRDSFKPLWNAKAFR